MIDAQVSICALVIFLLKTFEDLFVLSPRFQKVIQWCTYHKEDPPPPEDDDNREKRTDDIPSWDIEFLKVDQGTLFELILAANYLDIKGLLDVTCKTVSLALYPRDSE